MWQLIVLETLGETNMVTTYKMDYFKKKKKKFKKTYKMDLSLSFMFCVLTRKIDTWII